ncbi:hypothetical protein WMY93_009955 [Mugilogobius chulae]|uniref:Uncharacterized protein n=1 Tax=Mugilogobius chulae TaxID=88201 RepID=A0AAW0PHH7_9GOBI
MNKSTEEKEKTRSGIQEERGSGEEKTERRGKEEKEKRRRRELYTDLRAARSSRLHSTHRLSERETAPPRPFGILTQSNEQTVCGFILCLSQRERERKKTTTQRREREGDEGREEERESTEITDARERKKKKR